MLRSAWLLHWLNHGHQLTAIAAFSYEANASSNAAVYLFMLRWSADGQGDICRVSVLLACGARVYAPSLAGCFPVVMRKSGAG